MSRPSWDETWLAVARTVAARSLCSRAQVGAVITDTRNRIVATGYNGPPAGFSTESAVSDEPLTCEHWCDRGARQPNALEMLFPALLGPRPDYTDCPSLHAEANALLAADRSSWQGGTIYVTGAICHACGKLIANSGLARVVVGAEAEDRSYRVTGHDLLRQCGLVIDEI